MVFEWAAAHSRRTGENVVKGVLHGLRVPHGAIAQQLEAERAAHQKEHCAASKQHGEWVRARQIGELRAHRRRRCGLGQEMIFRKSA